MNKIELEKVSIELLAPHIVLVTPKNDCIIEVEDIKKIKETNLKITNGKKYGVISYTGINSSVSTEGRKYLASRKIEKNKLAAAYIITQLPQRLLFNFFIKFNKPSVLTKSFSEQQAALKWVKKILANY
ncbi:MAG: hypothetical protein HRT73_05980 [Flavobacteriales bacterium]|nr:hypothetical protein [Flavobacteriales bacterium]